MIQVNFPSRGETIYACAHIPECDKKVPAIIMCHGFTGSAPEGSKIFVKFAEKAVKEGFYVLRINCVGSGDSPASFAKYTNLSGWGEDIRSSIDYVCSQPQVDPERIYIIGVSMGGSTVLYAGADERVKRIVAWAPVVDLKAGFGGVVTKQRPDGRYYYGSKVFDLEQKFFDDVNSIDLFERVSSYKDKKILIMQGGADAVVDPAGAEKLVKMCPYKINYHYIEGETHHFMEYCDENLEESLDFFR